jgi:hypothetical protein
MTARCGDGVRAVIAVDALAVPVDRASGVSAVIAVDALVGAVDRAR